MTLFVIQNPWVFTLGILGNLISIIVYLAPAPTFYRIFKRKSTEGFHSFPYVVSLLSCMLWINYAMAKSEVLLLTINSVGCVVEAVYVIFFIVHAPQKPKIFTLKLVILLNIVGFGLICILAEFLTKGGAQKIQALGWINVAFSAMVYIAPLSVVKQVINTGSVEFMPFWLSVSLLLSALTWFSYGLLLKDLYIAAPSIVGFVSGIVQLALYIIYKNFKMAAKEQKPNTTNSSHIHPNPILSSAIEAGEIVVAENGPGPDPVQNEQKGQDPLEQV